MRLTILLLISFNLIKRECETEAATLVLRDNWIINNENKSEFKERESSKRFI